MQQPVGQTWNGDAPISNGAPGTTGPPTGDDPGSFKSVQKQKSTILI